MNVAATDDKAPTRDPARAASAAMTGPSSLMIAFMPPKEVIYDSLAYDDCDNTTMQIPFQLFLCVDAGGTPRSGTVPMFWISN
jgi:hypothetical protein